MGLAGGGGAFVFHWGVFCTSRRGAPAPGAQICPATVGWRRWSRAGWESDGPSRRLNVRVGDLRLTQGQLKRSLNETAQGETSSEIELDVSKTALTAID